MQAELGLDDVQTLERLAPAGAIYFLMDEADVERIMSHPLAMVGSDGLPFDPHPHPRQWGTFTRCCAPWCGSAQCCRLRPPSTR